MNGKEIDADSQITDGSYNAKRNEKWHDEIEQAKGKFFKGKKLAHGCYLCDVDEEKASNKEYRFFAKKKYSKQGDTLGTTDEEYILNTALMQCLTNAPNIIYVFKDYIIQQRINTNASAEINKRNAARLALLETIHGLVDRKPENAFTNTNGKLVNLDFENAVTKFAYSYSNLANGGFPNEHMLKQGLLPYQTSDLLEELKTLGKIDYEKFLTIYRETCNLCNVDKEKAQKALNDFMSRAFSYKQLLVDKIKKEIKEITGEKKKLYEKLLKYCEEDLSSFQAFQEKNKDVKIETIDKSKKPNNNNIKWHGIGCRFIRGIKKFWKWFKSLGYCANNNRAARNLRSGNSCWYQR